jgi:hypothetical protein
MPARQPSVALEYGGIYLLLGRYGEAVDALKHSNGLRPSFES